MKFFKSDSSYFWRDLYRIVAILISVWILIFTVSAKLEELFLQPLFTVLLLSTFLFSKKTAVKITRLGSGVTTFGDAFIFAGLFVFGKEGAILISMAEMASILTDFKERTIFSYAYQLSVALIRISIVAFILEQLFGDSSKILSANHFPVICLATASAGILAYLSNLLVSVPQLYLYLTKKEFDFALKHCLWSGPTFLIGAIIAVGIIQLIEYGGWISTIIFCLFCLIVYSTYQNYLKAFNALKSSESRFRGSFDFAPIGMAIVSLECKWLKINEELSRILSYEDFEVVDNLCQNFFHPDDIQSVGKEIYRLRDGEADAVQLECRLINKRDETVWILLSASTSHDHATDTRQLVFQIQDISLRKATESKLLYEANHDSLTGLRNRSHFTAKLEEIANGEKEYDNPLFCVLLIDLDNFKIINDTLGHEAGDELLKGAAERLSGCIHGNDTISRLGGDEFTILSVDLSESEQAVKIAERIKEKFGKPFFIAGREHYVSMSIGITVLSSGCGKNSKDIMSEADTAMYEAKSLGKNCYSVFSDEMNFDRSYALQIVGDLRKALENDELNAVYQPIYRLADMKIVGFETLIRWHHPVYGNLNPSEFVSLAEEFGMIRKLDYWIALQSCRKLKEWQNANPQLKDVFISVNASPRHFNKENFGDRISELLNTTKLEPHCLNIEITETALIKNLSNTSKTLKELKDMGVEAALDDFGTGYSSLSYLRELPISKLKIDRSFVNPIETGKRNSEILTAIVAMAKAVDIAVVAEGIETETQFSTLREIGCEYGQGYYFSAPVSEQKALKILLQSYSSADSVIYSEMQNLSSAVN